MYVIIWCYICMAQGNLSKNYLIMMKLIWKVENCYYKNCVVFGWGQSSGCEDFGEFFPKFSELVKRRYTRAVKKRTIVRALPRVRSVKIESVRRRFIKRATAGGGVISTPSRPVKDRSKNKDPSISIFLISFFGHSIVLVPILYKENMDTFNWCLCQDEWMIRSESKKDRINRWVVFEEGESFGGFHLQG